MSFEPVYISIICNIASVDLMPILLSRCVRVCYAMLIITYLCIYALKEYDDNNYYRKNSNHDGSMMDTYVFTGYAIIIANMCNIICLLCWGNLLKGLTIKMVCLVAPLSIISPLSHVASITGTCNLDGCFNPVTPLYWLIIICIIGIYPYLVASYFLKCLKCCDTIDQSAYQIMPEPPHDETVGSQEVPDATIKYPQMDVTKINIMSSAPFISDEIECCICTDKYDDLHDNILLSCGHVFHKKCIEKWSVRQDACPYCRSKIDYK
jgi:hypothetical protein